jgi:hypothetical protein
MNHTTTIDETNLDIQNMLTEALRGGALITDAHLTPVDIKLNVENTKTIAHCYRLTVDGNGFLRYKPLAEFLAQRIVDYAIPRSRIETAKKSLIDTGSTALILKLEKEAKGLFTSLANTGEGGELLVFALAEAVFGFTQVISKMSLKTSSDMHYHGADGVYAEGRNDGGLNVYWGESKLYGDPTSAIRDCLKSLAPFLNEPDGSDSERSRDIFLVNEFADFSDPKLVEGLKHYFDLDDKKSLSLRHCGIALVGFDCASYLEDGEQIDEIALEKELIDQAPTWVKQLKNRLNKEKIEQYDIHFICVPMRAVQEFREYFLGLLGH